MVRLGLFVGLTTLDFVYRVDRAPIANEKLVAADYTVAAGGPVTNAAVAFQYSGGSAMLLSAIGSHPITQLIRSDLQTCQVAIADLTPDRLDPPPVSSIMVTAATGDRAVVSINAVKAQVNPTDLPSIAWQQVAVVLIDGHQMAVGRAIAEHAKSHGIPVVVDGGSWKPGFESVLALTDYAICSANFLPPNCENAADTVAYLQALHVPHIAITRGSEPILFHLGDRSGTIAVPTVEVVDTMGAGDVFHGAFCAAILQQSFTEALGSAALVAARSCRSFGTRRWMRDAG